MSEPVKILLSAEEAAEAMSLGETAIREAARDHALPHIHWGRRLLFPVDSLREWALQRAEGGEADVSGNFV